MDSYVKLRLGDILVKAGKISEKQLQEALSAQKILGKKLGEILLDENIIDELDIIEAIEKQTGIKRIDLNNVNFDKKLIKLVPQNLCTKYTLIPFEFEDNKIKVAMSDPLNIYAMDDITISTGFNVEPYICLKVDINKFIGINYSNEEVNKAAEELTRESIQSKEVSGQAEDIDDVKTAPVVKMIDYMFRNSMEMRASDIHIEPYEEVIRIRYRIDGELKTINTLGIESLAPLVARIKILAGLNIAEKRIPQDGRIITKVGEKDVDLRVSILPVVNGEKIVIRILDRSNYQIGKEHLGLSGDNLRKLKNIISNPYGIVLVTGPTGSGKSTTLYTLLSELNSDEKNIVTVEDPVEYTLNGVNQVNVNVKSGMTFASGLRSILRQDPDIIMIGEIRDNETAEIAVRAAITGHLVLSTLHTNDACSSVVRLVDMGLEPYLVSTSVVGVIAQRLVKKICPHCKKEYEASDYEKRVLKVANDEKLMLFKGEGCGYCNNTGYIGRTGVYEIMEITDEHKNAIGNMSELNILKNISLKNGMTTLEQEGRQLVFNGVTTIEELAKITLLREV